MGLALLGGGGWQARPEGLCPHPLAVLWQACQERLETVARPCPCPPLPPTPVWLPPPAAGGVKKEFFQLLVSELISGDYGMLQLLPETNTYWCVWPAVDAAAVLLCLCACTCVCADACMQLCFCVCEC